MYLNMIFFYVCELVLHSCFLVFSNPDKDEWKPYYRIRSLIHVFVFRAKWDLEIKAGFPLGSIFLLSHIFNGSFSQA